MSSTEIEDVLSSIRRLVSEELRPMVRTRPVAGSAAAVGAPVTVPSAAREPAGSGKLILTPALRIVARPAVERPPHTPAPSAAAAAPAPKEPAAPQESTSPLPVFIATRRVNLATPCETAPAAAEAPFIEAEPAPIEQVVANLGAAVTAQPGDWEPEHGDAPMTGLAGESWAMPAVAFELEDGLDEPVPHAPALVAETAAQSAGAAVEVEAEAAPEAVDVPAWAQQDVAGQAAGDDLPEPLHGTVEPDAAWADAAEASIIASLQAEAIAAGQQPEAAESTGDAAEEEMRFNEDVLRELVRDILREELAGHMGVRITRNIRKLVRAEIATILATQELS